MRRTYISPEFKNYPTYGTFNMIEESNYFSAKMLEVEDSIYVEKQNIIWYQQSNGEQLDLGVESSLPTQVYSATQNKQTHHKLRIDESQQNYQKQSNTRWIMDIDLNSILTDYIYASIKRYRSFEGIQNYMTVTNDVNSALKKYIEYNVINRYKFSKLDLYINYKDLRDQNVLKYKNTWNTNVSVDSNLVKKVQTDLSFDGSSATITFSQEKTSQTYNFEYYFNILFEKI